MGCSISTRPMLALAMAAHPNHLQEVNRNWRRMAIYSVQTMSGPRRVRNLPGFRDPLVTIRRGNVERAQLMEGLQRLIAALFAAGAPTVCPCIAGYPTLRPPPQLQLLPYTLDHSNPKEPA